MNCDSRFLMNGHSNARSLPFEILTEIFVASDCNVGTRASPLDPGTMAVFTAQIHGRQYLSIVSFAQDVETTGSRTGGGFACCYSIQSGGFPITVRVQHQYEKLFSVSKPSHLL